MCSLKSHCRTSCRSSLDTIAVNYLVLGKIAFLCTHFGDRETDKRTDEQTDGQSQRVKSFSVSRVAP